MSKSDLDAFMASPGGGAPHGQSRCETCRDFPHLDHDIREFLRRKAAGEIHLPTVSVSGHKSLWTFLQTKGYRLGHISLTRHITLCLGIRHTTGRPLNEQA